MQSVVRVYCIFEMDKLQRINQALGIKQDFNHIRNYYFDTHSRAMDYDAQIEYEFNQYFGDVTEDWWNLQDIVKLTGRVPLSLEGDEYLRAVAICILELNGPVIERNNQPPFGMYDPPVGGLLGDGIGQSNGNGESGSENKESEYHPSNCVRFESSCGSTEGNGSIDSNDPPPSTPGHKNRPGQAREIQGN